MVADFRIPLVLIFLIGISYFIIQKAAIPSFPAISFHSYPAKTHDSTVRFNDKVYEGWKSILIQLLERLRQGIPLSQEQEEIIDGMYEILQQYSASMASKAEELLGLIQMIQQIHEGLIKQYPDEGQRRTDNEHKPGE